MKILHFFLVCIVCNALHAEIFWEEYDIANAGYKNRNVDMFIKNYFDKPLKNLKDAYIQVEVMDISMIENLKEECKIFEADFGEKNNRCFTESKELCYSHPRNAEDMQQYILESIEVPFPMYYSNYYAFMEDNVCGYTGKVKIFGYVWYFYSRGGGIILTRNIDKEERLLGIEQNSLQAYRQGYIWDKDNKVAKKYLVCKSQFCSPRAELEYDELE